MNYWPSLRGGVVKGTPLGGFFSPVMDLIYYMVISGIRHRVMGECMSYWPSLKGGASQAPPWWLISFIFFGLDSRLIYGHIGSDKG